MLSLSISSILAFLCWISSFSSCLPIELVEPSDSDGVSTVFDRSTAATVFTMLWAGMLDLAMSMAVVCASVLDSTELALCLCGDLEGSTFSVAAFGGAAPALASVCEEVRDCCKLIACACEDVFSAWHIENWHALRELSWFLCSTVRAASLVEA